MEEGHVELQELLEEGQLQGLALQSVNNLYNRVEIEPVDRMRFCLGGIGMIPCDLRELSASSFSPRVVSIGPLHREDETVQPFRCHKTHYVMQLLSLITSEVHVLMGLCITRVCPLMNRIKQFYGGVNFKDDDRETAYMLCEDSLFILGFFLACLEPGDNNSHSKNMPSIETIVRDFILIENQIPLFILDEIYECTILTIKPDTTLVSLLFTVLSCNNPSPVDMNLHINSTNDVPHILGFVLQCCVPLASQGSSSYLRLIIPSGASLIKAGVNLKPNKNSKSGLAMKVTVCNKQCLCRGDANLEMPVLHVDVGTESVLWNFIVYEQLCTSSKPIASYLKVIGMLLKTREDVYSLVNSGVLINSMGTGEEVVNMFKTILEKVTVVDSFYEEEWKKLNKYCNVNWTAWVRRIWCSSPTKIFVSFISIITLASGVVQTIYTIKSAENKSMNQF